MKSSRADRRGDDRGIPRRSFIKRAAGVVGALVALPWAGLQVFARPAYGYGGPYWVDSNCQKLAPWGYCEPLLGCILAPSGTNPGGRVWSSFLNNGGCTGQCYIDQGKGENCQLFLCMCDPYLQCICYCNVVCF